MWKPITGNGVVTDAADLTSGEATDGYVLTADGAGGVAWEVVPAVGGITDHGALTGLSDDDHTQYHTDARGDARYAATAHNHTGTYLESSGGTVTNIKETRYATTTSGNVTINLANGNVQRFILDAARQFTMPADPGDIGQSFVLILECATYTPTWNSSPAIEWLTSDGLAPTLVTTANYVNVLTFIWDDTDSRWLGFLSGKES